MAAVTGPIRGCDRVDAAAAGRVGAVMPGLDIGGTGMNPDDSHSVTSSEVVNGVPLMVATRRMIPKGVA